MNERAPEAKAPVLDVRRANYGKRDHEIFSVHAYGLGLTSLGAIIDLASFCNLHTLSLHNNDISRIECLESITSLTELNLSSNNIQTIQGLSTLTSLETLNLASNTIQRVQGLEGLTALRKLVLSHNQIESLEGLSALHGPRYSLTILDLRDNLVASLSELWVLAGLSKLRTLVLSAGHQCNPVCSLPNYRQSTIAALPGVQSLDGSPTRSPLEPPQTILPTPQVEYAAVQAIAPSMQKQDDWRQHATLKERERVASGAFTSTSFTPQIDQALHGFYRRRAPRQGPFSQGQQSRGPQPDHQKWEQRDDTHGFEAGVWDLERGRFAEAAECSSRVDQRDGFSNAEHQQKAEYEARIGVLESRLLDLVDKVEKGRAAKSGPEGGPLQKDDTDPSRDEKQYRGSTHHFASKQAGDLERTEEEVAGMEDRLRFQKGEKEAGKSVPWKSGKVQTRTLIHGHGGQEGKNKIVNMGTQRLLALVNDRKNKRGPAAPMEPQKLRAVMVTDEATQTSVVEDFRVSRLSREVDALQKELEAVSAELAQRDAANIKAKAVAAQEKEEREKASIEALKVKTELEGSLQKVEKERKEERAAWTKKERERDEALSEAERRAEAKARNLEAAQESLAKLEAQALVAKSQAVSDAVATVQRELAEVWTAKMSLDAQLAAAVVSRQKAEEELEREKSERALAEECMRALHTGAEEARKKGQAALAEAEAAKVGESAARDEARRLASALALCHEDHQIAINHLKELHAQEVQNLVEREAAYGREKAALESTHAQATWQLEGRVRDLERDLRQASQDNSAERQQLQSSLMKAEKEAAENRRALRASLQKESQAEELVAELTEVVRRQKAKIEALQQERIEAEPRRGEVLALRKRVEELAAKGKELETLLSEKEVALLDARAAFDKQSVETRELSSALEKLREEERRWKEEETLLRQKVELAEDKVKIKDKMLDSQNASIGDLKAQIAQLKDALREAEESVGRAESEGKERLRDEIEQGRALRAELEAQDATLVDLEDKLEAERTSAKKAAAEVKELKAKLDEKDGVLRFVEQEVDRVKSLFDSKEQTLALERDKASECARAAEANLREALERGEAERQEMQKRIDALQLECERLRKASAASEAALADVQTSCHQRVAEVEEEMRSLLLAMDRQKSKSAAKVQQLSALLDELKRSS